MKRTRFIAIIIILSLSLILTLQSGVGVAQDFGTNWTAQFYNNTTLTGSPIATRIDNAINFNWGAGSPFPGFVNDDNFSIRWTGTQSIADGTYQFTASADDGIRVSVDGTVIIDQLGASGSFQTHTAQAILSGGTHTIVVEYVELTGTAAAQFQWQLTTPGATQAPSPTPGPTLTPSNTPLPFIPPGALTATVIRAGVLNVRDAPSLGGNRIGRILRGQTYQVVGRDENARWFLLELGGFRGWAWGYYLFIDGNEFNAPISTATSVLGFPAGVTDFGVLAQTQAVMKLRAAPTVLSEQTGRISWGAFIPIVGRTHDNGWYQVVWKGTVGWAFSGFIRIRAGDLSVVPVTG